MKICPKCGSEMKSNVNFCTKCGADLRNIPVNKNISKIQSTTSTREANTAMIQDNQHIYEQDNAQSNQQTVGQKFTYAIHNFDARNMWQWFVNSWKHPFKEQKVEKWYGWVTLLVENILFTLGLFIFIHRLISKVPSQFSNYAAGLSNLSGSVIFQLFIGIVLAEAITIAGAYLAHKFVYGQNENIFDFINHIVGMSNLAAIFVVASFIFMIFGSDLNVLSFGFSLDTLAAILFSLASLTVVVADKQTAVHDRFYGLLIVVIIEFLGIIISLSIFGQNVSNIINQMKNAQFNNNQY